MATATSKIVEEEEEVEPKEQNEDNEEGECGFCLYMKAGGCRDAFIAWEKCVENAEKNKELIVDKCSEVTVLLKDCMEQYKDYYSPVLRAEKAAEEEASREHEGGEGNYADKESKKVEASSSETKLDTAKCDGDEGLNQKKAPLSETMDQKDFSIDLVNQNDVKDKNG